MLQQYIYIYMYTVLLYFSVPYSVFSHTIYCPAVSYLPSCSFAVVEIENTTWSMNVFRVSVACSVLLLLLLLLTAAVKQQHVS